MSASKKSKIPLRGIGKLFTHLDAGIRAKLESAFAEAENLINYHNESVIGKQDKRVISGYVSAPIVVLTQNSRGFDATWERLDDPYISFYEAQVSLTSNFADPSSYNLTETSLTVEGVGETVYIRVRGVRWDGDTGNWSNTVQTSFSTSGPITYSRGLDDVPSFYITYPGNLFPGPIQRIRITPQRQNGGMMIFGSFAATTSSGGDPTLIATLNGVTVSQVSQADYIGIHGPQEGTGCAIGPVFVGHDQFYFGDVESHLATARATSGSFSGSGTYTDWSAANPTGCSVTYPLGSVLQTSNSKYVNFTGFNFSVPAGNTIIGIKVDYTGTGSATSDLLELRLLDAGAARADKVGIEDWGGSKSYGSRTDLWGEVDGYWTPAKINDSNFGIRLKARLYMEAFNSGTRSAIMTWPTITVYSTNETTGEVDVQIRFNGTLNEGELLACTLNVIEFGEAL